MQIEQKRPRKKFYKKPEPVSDVPQSLSALKKSLRASHRILFRDSIHADVRMEHERRIAAQLSLLVERQRCEIEKNHMTRYKQVKFVEKTKAQRKMRQCVVAQSEESIWRSAVIEYLYISVFPKTIKYLSLYAKQAADETIENDRQASILAALKEAQVPQMPTDVDKLERLLKRSEWKQKASDLISKKCPFIQTELSEEIEGMLKSTREMLGSYADALVVEEVITTGKHEIQEEDYEEKPKKLKKTSAEPVDDFFGSAESTPNVLSRSAAAIREAPKWQ